MKRLAACQSKPAHGEQGQPSVTATVKVEMNVDIATKAGGHGLVYLLIFLWDLMGVQTITFRGTNLVYLWLHIDHTYP